MDMINKQQKDLFRAILTLKTEPEVEHFLRDIMTRTEIDEAVMRFQIAKLLWQKKMTYIEIAEHLGTSTTTVTRVADWLWNKEYGGYRTALGRMK
jgi:TrpR-related protein YerC/YecD